MPSTKIMSVNKVTLVFIDCNLNVIISSVCADIQGYGHMIPFKGTSA